MPTRSSPVRHVGAPKSTPFDLHALGTPPALILSQDQTLHQLSLLYSSTHTPTAQHRPRLRDAHTSQLPHVRCTRVALSCSGPPRSTVSSSTPCPRSARANTGFAPSSAHSSPCAPLLMCSPHVLPYTRIAPSPGREAAAGPKPVVNRSFSERRRCRFSQLRGSRRQRMYILAHPFPGSQALRCGPKPCRSLTSRRPPRSRGDERNTTRLNAECQGNVADQFFDARRSRRSCFPIA